MFLFLRICGLMQVNESSNGSSPIRSVRSDAVGSPNGVCYGLPALKRTTRSTGEEAIVVVSEEIDT